MAAFLKRLSFWVMAGFYLAAGINHFRHPDFYLPLIPKYLPFPWSINVVSGIAEIALALGLTISRTRRYAAWGIMVMLVLFIPSHVYFIQIGSCVEGGLCVEPWIAWVRLVIIHPLLILWAWYHRQ